MDWTVDDGWNVLVGVNRERIVRMMGEFESKGKQKDIFGDGKASVKIEGVIGML